MGGSTLPFFEPIAERYGLNINVVNPVIDPAFGFMTSMEMARSGWIVLPNTPWHALSG